MASAGACIAIVLSSEPLPCHSSFATFSKLSILSVFLLVANPILSTLNVTTEAHTELQRLIPSPPHTDAPA
jgi:hypothetical protein